MIKQLFFKRLHSSKRTYFFNVNKKETEAPFIQIIESKAIKGGKYNRSKITINDQDAEQFEVIFQEALAVLKQKK